MMIAHILLLLVLAAPGGEIFSGSFESFEGWQVITSTPQPRTCQRYLARPNLMLELFDRAPVCGTPDAGGMVFPECSRAKPHWVVMARGFPQCVKSCPSCQGCTSRPTCEPGAQEWIFGPEACSTEGCIGSPVSGHGG